MPEATSSLLVTLRRHPLSRWMVRLNNRLVRRNAFGMGRTLMLVEHRGRRSNEIFETTISYLADAEGVWAWTRSGQVSNWYQNCASARHARIWIAGEPHDVGARALTQDKDIALAFDAARKRFGSFRVIFGVKRDASPEALKSARDRWCFMRFTFARDLGREGAVVMRSRPQDVA